MSSPPSLNPNSFRDAITRMKNDKFHPIFSWSKIQEYFSENILTSDNQRIKDKIYLELFKEPKHYFVNILLRFMSVDRTVPEIERFLLDFVSDESDSSKEEENSCFTKNWISKDCTLLDPRCESIPGKYFENEMIEDFLRKGNFNSVRNFVYTFHKCMIRKDIWSPQNWTTIWELPVIVSNIYDAVLGNNVFNEDVDEKTMTAGSLRLEFLEHYIRYMLIFKFQSEHYDKMMSFLKDELSGSKFDPNNFPKMTSIYNISATWIDIIKLRYPTSFLKYIRANAITGILSDFIPDDLNLKKVITRTIFLCWYRPSQILREYNLYINFFSNHRKEDVNESEYVAFLQNLFIYKRILGTNFMVASGWTRQPYLVTQESYLMMASLLQMSGVRLVKYMTIADVTRKCFSQNSYFAAKFTDFKNFIGNLRTPNDHFSKDMSSKAFCDLIEENNRKLIEFYDKDAIKISHFEDIQEKIDGLNMSYDKFKRLSFIVADYHCTGQFESFLMRELHKTTINDIVEIENFNNHTRDVDKFINIISLNLCKIIIKFKRKFAPSMNYGLWEIDSMVTKALYTILQKIPEIFEFFQKYFEGDIKTIVNPTSIIWKTGMYILLNIPEFSRFKEERFVYDGLLELIDFGEEMLTSYSLQKDSDLEGYRFLHLGIITHQVMARSYSLKDKNHNKARFIYSGIKSQQAMIPSEYHDIVKPIAWNESIVKNFTNIIQTTTYKKLMFRTALGSTTQVGPGKNNSNYKSTIMSPSKEVLDKYFDQSSNLKIDSALFHYLNVFSKFQSPTKIIKSGSSETDLICSYFNDFESMPLSFVDSKDLPILKFIMNSDLAKIFALDNDTYFLHNYLPYKFTCDLSSIEKSRFSRGKNLLARNTTIREFPDDFNFSSAHLVFIFREGAQYPLTYYCDKNELKLKNSYVTTPEIDKEERKFCSDLGIQLQLDESYAYTSQELIGNIEKSKIFFKNIANHKSIFPLWSNVDLSDQKTYPVPDQLLEKFIQILEIMRRKGIMHFPELSKQSLKNCAVGYMIKQKIVDLFYEFVKYIAQAIVERPYKNLIFNQIKFLVNPSVLDNNLSIDSPEIQRIIYTIEEFIKLAKTQGTELIVSPDLSKKIDEYENEIYVNSKPSIPTLKDLYPIIYGMQNKFGESLNETFVDEGVFLNEYDSRPCEFKIPNEYINLPDRDSIHKQINLEQQSAQLACMFGWRVRFFTDEAWKKAILVKDNYIKMVAESQQEMFPMYFTKLNHGTSDAVARNKAKLVKRFENFKKVVPLWFKHTNLKWLYASSFNKRLCAMNPNHQNNIFDKALVTILQAKFGPENAAFVSRYRKIYTLVKQILIIYGQDQKFKKIEQFLQRFGKVPSRKPSYSAPLAVTDGSEIPSNKDKTSKNTPQDPQISEFFKSLKKTFTPETSTIHFVEEFVDANPNYLEKSPEKDVFSYPMFLIAIINLMFIHPLGQFIDGNFYGKVQKNKYLAPDKKGKDALQEIKNLVESKSTSTMIIDSIRVGISQLLITTPVYLIKNFISTFSNRKEGSGYYNLEEFFTLGLIDIHEDIFLSMAEFFPSLYINDGPGSEFFLNYVSKPFSEAVQWGGNNSEMLKEISNNPIYQNIVLIASVLPIAAIFFTRLMSEGEKSKDEFFHVPYIIQLLRLMCPIVDVFSIQTIGKILHQKTPNPNIQKLLEEKYTYGGIFSTGTWSEVGKLENLLLQFNATKNLIPNLREIYVYIALYDDYKKINRYSNMIEDINSDMKDCITQIAKANVNNLFAGNPDFQNASVSIYNDMKKKVFSSYESDNFMFDDKKSESNISSDVEESEVKATGIKKSEKETKSEKLDSSDESNQSTTSTASSTSAQTSKILSVTPESNTSLTSTPAPKISPKKPQSALIAINNIIGGQIFDETSTNPVPENFKDLAVPININTFIETVDKKYQDIDVKTKTQDENFKSANWIGENGNYSLRTIKVAVGSQKYKFIAELLNLDNDDDFHFFMECNNYPDDDIDSPIIYLFFVKSDETNYKWEIARKINEKYNYIDVNGQVEIYDKPDPKEMFDSIREKHPYTQIYSLKKTMSDNFNFFDKFLEELNEPPL